MAATDKTGIQATTVAQIRSGSSDTTALGLRLLIYQILDSYANIVDGGFVYQTQVGYNAEIALTDNKAFVYKKYLTDLLALKQDAGAIAGGDLSGNYPNPTVLNSAVLNKILTGLIIAGTTISPSDNILTAFGKLQSQINSLLGGVSYQGLWNAATNSPTLSDGTGVKGHYYVVSVPFTRNLGSGPITFDVSDWVIHNGVKWEKVDNSDAVNSVNGFTGTVLLTTNEIPEASNLYFTEARVLASILLGYEISSGDITEADTVIGAIQKLDGNVKALEAIKDGEYTDIDFSGDTIELDDLPTVVIGVFLNGQKLIIDEDYYIEGNLIIFYYAIANEKIQVTYKYKS